MTSPSTSSFVKREPVIAAHLAAAVVGYVLAALVTHHVLGSATASALTQQLVPAVASGLLVALGFLVRHFVEPASAHIMLEASSIEPDVLHLDESTISKLSKSLSGIITGVEVDGKKLMAAVKRDDGPTGSITSKVPVPTQPTLGGGSIGISPQTTTAFPMTTSGGTAQTTTIVPTQAEAVAAAQPVQPAPTQGA